ncbi:MarR family winged helix-turn-helix transcriptional regulator [Pseudonocardia cypriaca]|uniref:DNA-binding MarR family transcriptional regulator n=1 Tax=Pseudonocardia cypriaca TaxID=882449 RepID=A0A543GCP3_9PSEU|nr:MarR family winged helix-turn-helix transcriptional regulator [Pseudonocardia cypriaca]TQM43849.1 DNA-binding MarR family transcriptional regulator [Pseudonocardia cypriaca]
MAEQAGRHSAVLALREAPGHLIRCAQQRHTLLWTQEFGGDLTGPQYAVISAIGSDHGLDQRAVGRRASLDKSSTANVVARLEGQGWLRLAKDPADRRRTSLSLTPVARAALSEVTRRAGAVQERLLAPVPEARREPFVAALRRVAFEGDPPPPGSAHAQVLDLGDTPGHLIRRAQQVHTTAWGAEVGRTMTAPQYAVLSALWDHPDGIDQGAAAELASIDTSSMVDIVRRLATRDRVTSTRAPADARRRRLHLTDTARHELAGLTPAVQRVQELLLRPLDSADQRRTLLDGLRALAFATADATP